MRGPGIFSFKVLESPGKVLEFCSVVSVATQVVLISVLRSWKGPGILFCRKCSNPSCINFSFKVLERSWNFVLS